MELYNTAAYPYFGLLVDGKWLFSILGSVNSTGRLSLLTIHALNNKILKIQQSTLHSQLNQKQLNRWSIFVPIQNICLKDICGRLRELFGFFFTNTNSVPIFW